ncbi:RdgB/HAM1 family non-canonical purine NTP pyrophosphatase [Sphingobacterium sp. Mn56C]|uniref:RdgB/HAM1 family non-canonical purine NTP pyrophosphatase n=1 Tax=Sphingobacterium sp. Mn56C TaxID=3395261 RepID=UPI003BE6E71E
MKIELVFATNNAHKLGEVQAMVGDKFLLQSLSEINCHEDIPETGVTFHENAKQKTDYLVKNYQVINCFGDDSGLLIDALDGEPGVYSARYSGSRDMAANINLVMQRMAGKANRSARFKTVISLYLNGAQYFFEGSVEGTIIEEQRGTEGFGYDPIFIPLGATKTFAEMSASDKNAISHRSIAIGKMVDFLKDIKL